jgi:hypothetical protein
MIANILIAVGVVVALFLIFVATRPADFRVTRSISIAAPAGAVFTQVNDLHNWDAWSPWAKLDPAAKRTFEGAAAGEGAVFKWSGNKKIGEGSMTILESRPVDLVRIRLEFLKPYKATNLVEFTFRPDSNHTAVNWSMSGKKNFFFKAFCLFVNMDKMIGGDFERGLASLKILAEARSGK